MRSVLVTAKNCAGMALTRSGLVSKCAADRETPAVHGQNPNGRRNFTDNTVQICLDPGISSKV